MDGDATAIIGRDDERAAIEGALAAPRPTALVVEGEAGVGKTTLWTFALEVARGRGERVVAWRASSAESELAFGALMGLLDGLGDQAFNALDAPRRRALDLALGRVDPEGRAPEPGLVGLAMLDLIRALAADGPVVVGLDDVQWCDPATAGALAFAARRLRSEPVALVLANRTGRTTPPPSEIVSALPPDRLRRVALGPLTIGAIGRLIQERLGVTHPRPLLVRVHEASAGNPFVALEMSRSLISRGAQPAPGEPFPVSPEAGPLVRDHLASLSPTARRALVLVAMSSQPTVALLGRVLGDEATSAVDEACAAGILVEDGARLRPAHPLFASTSYADTPPGERRTLRSALADAADDPLERAVHRAATVEGVAPAVADELEAAAKVALRRGAPGVAADLLERAAGLVVDADRDVALRIGSAEARYRAGDADAAGALLRALLLEVPSGRRRTEALLALAEIVCTTHPSDALPLLSDALVNAAGDPLLEAMVHSTIGGMADPDPATYDRSARAAFEILDRPDVHPEPDHLACALLERAYMWLVKGERLASEDIDRALGLLTGAGDTFIARRAQEVAERCLYHTGRMEESLALDEAEYRRLTDLGQVGLLPPLVQSMAVLEQLLGDWAGRSPIRAGVRRPRGRGRGGLARSRPDRPGPDPRLGWRPRCGAGHGRRGPRQAGDGRRSVGGRDLPRPARVHRAVRARSSGGAPSPARHGRGCGATRGGPADHVPLPRRPRGSGGPGGRSRPGGAGPRGATRGSGRTDPDPLDPGDGRPWPGVRCRPRGATRTPPSPGSTGVSRSSTAHCRCRSSGRGRSSAGVRRSCGPAGAGPHGRTSRRRRRSSSGWAPRPGRSGRRRSSPVSVAVPLRAGS